MIAGYDPHRIAELAARTEAALDALADITSTDPAADGAMTAADRLRRVLETGLLPAVRAIAAADPLVRGARGARPPSGGIDGMFASLLARRYHAMTDDQLFDVLVRLELDAPFDAAFRPDMQHAFWLGFAALAGELAARAATDERFADLLVDRSSHSFLVPMAVEFAAFDPVLVGRMLREVTRTPSAIDDLRSRYQARGAEALMTALAGHPREALDALDADMVQQLVEWPLVDHGVVATFLHTAMELPFDEPTRLTDAYGVLRQFVVLANERRHDAGFPPALSPAITRIVVQYVPFFATSLGGYADVHLKDFEFRDIGMRLGSYPEVLDLFGALVRDRASLDIVLASIPGLALIGSGDHGPLGIGPDDVADWVDTIGKAAENERIEEQIKADRGRRNALLATDIAFGALRMASSVMGPVAIAGVEVALSLLEHGTTSVVDWLTEATDLGFAEVRNSAFLLVVFGLGVGVLRSRSSRGDAADSDRPDDAETLAQADDILVRIETRLEAGSDVEDLGGLINDFGRLVRSVDDDQVMEILDDSRVLPPDHDVEDHVDTD